MLYDDGKHACSSRKHSPVVGVEPTISDEDGRFVIATPCGRQIPNGT